MGFASVRRLGRDADESPKLGANPNAAYVITEVLAISFFVSSVDHVAA